MGTSFYHPTFASGGLDTTRQGVASIDEDMRHRPNWSYQRRGPKSQMDKAGWLSLWSFGSMALAVDPASRSEVWRPPDPYEPFTALNYGCQSQKFIKGQCLDVASVPVPAAIVQGFVTSTDEYVGEVTAAADGTYVLGTNQLSSAAHYLVGYKAGSPDIMGTTVNTLTPANIDA